MTPRPRALCGLVWASGRPMRPIAEGAAVRAAAAAIAAETGVRSDTATANILARRVIAELADYLSEDGDPFLMALGDFKRRSLPCPVTTLATDPNINTLALFIEARVDRLRARNGSDLSLLADKAERISIMDDVEALLCGRYLRQLRS